MICSHHGCGGKLRISHTYSLAAAKYQRAECSRCGRIHTLTTVAELALARGDGAKAKARAAERVKP